MVSWAAHTIYARRHARDGKQNKSALTNWPKPLLACGLPCLSRLATVGYACELPGQRSLVLAAASLHRIFAYALRLGASTFVWAERRDGPKCWPARELV